MGKIWFKKDEIISLTHHFNTSEFVCHCQEEHPCFISDELVRKLEELRMVVDTVITINSGFRCKDYNTIIGGKPNSQHLEGMAADIVIAGIPPVVVGDLAHRLGFGGIGIYNTFTHVDVRFNPAAWDNRTEHTVYHLHEYINPETLKKYNLGK